MLGIGGKWVTLEDKVRYTRLQNLAKERLKAGGGRNWKPLKVFHQRNGLIALVL